MLQKISATDREIANLMKFIRAGDDSQTVRTDLKQLEQQKLILADEQQQLDRQPRNEVVIPPASELRQVIYEAFNNLPIDDFEFAKRLRALTGNILVWPFQCIDGTGIVPRAKFTLQLTNLIADAQLREALRKPLERVITVDLFDPPEPVKWREEVMLRRKSATERAVANDLGITITVAHRAAGLDRRMSRNGTFDVAVGDTGLFYLHRSIGKIKRMFNKSPASDVKCDGSENERIRARWLEFLRIVAKEVVCRLKQGQAPK